MKKYFGWILLAALVCVLSAIPFATNALTDMKTIHISVPDFQVGDAITTDFNVTCQGAVLKEISGWYRESGYPAEEAAFGYDNYFVVLRFTEPSGKAFDPDTVHPVINNYKYSCAFYFEDNYKTLAVDITFRFAQYVYINTPEFQLGDAITTELDITCQGAVLEEITQWYDENGEPVAGGRFENANYCLRMKFTHPEGKAFDPEAVQVAINNYENGSSFFLENNNKTLVVNAYFTIMNIVRIYTPIFQVGDIITSDLDITCQGSVVKQSASWYDEDGEYVTGYFRNDHGYILRVRFADPKGQRIDTDGLIVLADEYPCSWWIENDGYTLGVDIYVDFGIKQAKEGDLENLPASITPGPVTDLSDLNMYGHTYLESACWVDEDRQPVSRFEEGKLYYLEAHIAPAAGYEFRDFFFLSANVGVAESSWIFSEREVIAWYPYTPEQTTITSVWITDMPRTIDIGHALLTDLYVPMGASYTPAAVWYRLPEQEIVTEADRNGSYVLLAVVNADEGSTFAKNVTVTVDGELFKAFLNLGNQLILCKAYNVGLSTIDRIDAAVTAPSLGAAPQLPTSNNSRYSFTQSIWLSGQTDELMASDECHTFTAGNYHYLLLISQAADGYAFPDDAEVYVNGQKTTLLDINAGNLRFTVVSFGKLVDLNNLQRGDLNKDGSVDEDDAIYLLRHVLMPGSYKVDEDVDYNKSGKVDEDDAIYLLRHVLMPGNYPLQ